VSNSNTDKLSPKSIFVTGGARSGKSSFALKLAEGIEGEKIFLATARALDNEMEKRIKMHRESRGGDWSTIEESNGIAKVIDIKKNGSVILLDCLTLWVTNLIEDGMSDKEVLGEVEILAAASKGANVITVSNEVGLGIVPLNPLARRFRDLAGTVNQKMTAAADEVYFLVSGIGMRIK